MWEAIKGFLSLAGLLDKLTGMWRDKQTRDQGAVAQREATNETELKTTRDDRVRDSNDALNERVRDDHGITIRNP